MAGIQKRSDRRVRTKIKYMDSGQIEYETAGERVYPASSRKRSELRERTAGDASGKHCKWLGARLERRCSRRERSKSKASGVRAYSRVLLHRPRAAGEVD